MSLQLRRDRRARAFVFGAVLALGMPLVAALVVGTRSPLAAADPAEATARTTFLVLYRPGPAWAPGKPITEQPPKEHGKYLVSMYAKGTMKFAGPFTDNTGGAVVIEVGSEAEAIAFARADPAVQKGVFLYEVHPWRLVPWQKYVK